MEADSVVEYRGHEIRIVVIAPTDPRHPSYRVAYEIRRIDAANPVLESGTIAGAFLSANEAVDHALRSAKRALDDRIN